MLSAVSCTSATACTAVGSGVTNFSSPPPVLRWNGSGWSIERSAKPVTSMDWSFAGVSCPSATNCVAVGSLETTAGRSIALAERWDGSSWQVTPIPTPGRRSRSSELTAVSGTSPTACTAVGDYGMDPVSGFGFSLIERWNGSKWMIQPAPKASRYLNGVCCTARRLCTAVGVDATTPGGVVTVQPIALRWAGGGWSLSEAPSGFGASELLAVSCATAHACITVGDANEGSGPSSPLGGQWDGVRWRGPETPGAPIQRRSTRFPARPGRCAPPSATSGRS